MNRKNIFKLPIYAVLLVGTILVLYPVFLMVITSLKTAGEVIGNPIGLPASPQWSNYATGFIKGEIGRASVNSLLYTVLSVAGLVVVSLMAAYVISRFSFKGRELVRFYFLSGLMVPFQIVLIPLFKLIKDIHLFNNIWGVIIIYISIGIPFAFFLYTGYLKSIPVDIEESAYIDGCSYYRIFWSIVLPLTKPATATVVIFNVLAVWNDFFVPLVFITDKKLKPVQLAVYSFVGQYTSEWHILFACMTMALIPVVLLYIFLQRYFISGMMSGAIKG